MDDGTIAGRNFGNALRALIARSKAFLMAHVVKRLPARPEWSARQTKRLLLLVLSGDREAKIPMAWGHPT